MRSSLYFVLVVHIDRGSAWAAFLREIPNYSLLHNNTLSTHQCVSLVYNQCRNHNRRPLSSINQYMRFSVTGSFTFSHPPNLVYFVTS